MFYLKTSKILSISTSSKATIVLFLFQELSDDICLKWTFANAVFNNWEFKYDQMDDGKKYDLSFMFESCLFQDSLLRMPW